jgi:uncharacterized protein (TIGR03085 family)
MARYTEHAQQRLRAKTPFPMLVEIIRKGPPRFSLFGIPGIDAKANFAEYFVHHEDVRRAQPGWEPRDLDDALADAIWSQLSQARFLLRKVPVGIEFARDDTAGRAETNRRVRMTVRARTPMVTVIGAPAELLMWTFGRTDAARIKLEGAEADVAALEKARWGI